MPNEMVRLAAFIELGTALEFIRPLHQLIKQVFPADELFDHFYMENIDGEIVIYCSHELARCAVNAEVTL
jgi:hypothetical protein